MCSKNILLSIWALFKFFSRPVCSLFTFELLYFMGLSVLVFKSLHFFFNADILPWEADIAFLVSHPYRGGFKWFVFSLVYATHIT